MTARSGAGVYLTARTDCRGTLSGIVQNTEICQQLKCGGNAGWGDKPVLGKPAQQHSNVLGRGHLGRIVLETQSLIGSVTRAIRRAIVATETSSEPGPKALHMHELV